MSPSRAAIARPCGSWPSELSAEAVVAGGVRLSQARLCAGQATWLEGRPAESGRHVVCRGAVGAPPEDRTPADVSVRSRVHEYGGGDYGVSGDALYFIVEGGGIGCLRGDAHHAVPGTAPDARYADPVASPDGRWLVAVEERADGAGVHNRLIALPTAGGTPVAFASSHDFVSSPCFSPDGRRLAYLTWEHPDMPWDAGVLRELPFGPEGPAGPARAAAGNERREAIFQPGYSPDGALSFVSDRDGWWNLHQERDGAVRNLHPCEAEFGVPQWVFGLTTWGFASPERIVCSVRSDGFDRVCTLDVASGALRDLALPLSAVSSLAVDAERVVLIGAAPDRAEGVFELRFSDGRFAALRPEDALPLATDAIAAPESLSFETGQGERAHAFYYAPRNAAAEPTPGERPPLLVKIHGGPTAAASPGLDLGVQYWTQRGFGVVDVNHRGSTGFGRAFRARLDGGWGVVDVEDCVAVARWLVAQGRVDGARLAIRGGSAGGFTALSALTFHDVFAVGCSRYGIGDLAALVADTHKFESHYTQRLVAPWPEGEAVYRARSPLHHVDRLDRPVIFFQGTEDRIVPPSQTERIVAALRERGVPHAYVCFEGEGHGFRRAQNLITSLEGERWFYGRILGFEVGPPPSGVTLRGAGPRAEL
ncbi:MAG: S9 family peptidase [Myxococcales bacterium]|nr:S9 family peptidase [Myxococcales bacterium]